MLLLYNEHVKIKTLSAELNNNDSENLLSSCQVLSLLLNICKFIYSLIKTLGRCSSYPHFIEVKSQLRLSRSYSQEVLEPRSEHKLSNPKAHSLNYYPILILLLDCELDKIMFILKIKSFLESHNPVNGRAPTVWSLKHYMKTFSNGES